MLRYWRFDPPGVAAGWHHAGMSNTATTRPVIRASVSDIAALAEFLSLLFDAPVTITAADEVIAAPAERHLVMIVAESGGAA
jgi:hypothetical protein